jgi:hypothetical protein
MAWHIFLTLRVLVFRVMLGERAKREAVMASNADDGGIW